MQIAEKLGYSNKNISKWENGEITPDIYILNRLANIYGISLDDLINGEHPNKTDVLNQEIQENTKLKKKIAVLSLLTLTFFVLILSCAVSTFFICTNPQSKFCYMSYVYGVTIVLFCYYLFYRAKNVVASIVLLVCFIASLFLSIFFTFNISPLLFLLAIPLFCFLFFYNSLANLLKKYKSKFGKKNSNTHLNDDEKN